MIFSIGLRLCAVVIATLGFAVPSFAISNTCARQLENNRRITITEFISSAEEIAIYNVKSAEPLSDSGSEPRFSVYRLELHNPIKGDAPAIIDVVGLEPYLMPPEHYFGALRRFEQLDQSDSLSFGSTGRGEGPDGECILLPRFVVGYTYVVVRGPIESRASYEPVLDFVQNRWLRLIYDVVQSRSENR